MTKSAFATFSDRNSAVNLLVGHGFIESSFARWTLGERVYGDSKGGRFLKRLDAPPSEFWEIRITEPTVQARAIGRFAEPDTFIVTAIHTRGYLGKRGSAAWQKAGADCENAWANVFGTTPPFAGKVIFDYVTQNCDIFPI